MFHHQSRSLIRPINLRTPLHHFQFLLPRFNPFRVRFCRCRAAFQVRSESLFCPTEEVATIVVGGEEGGGGEVLFVKGLEGFRGGTRHIERVICGLCGG